MVRKLFYFLLFIISCQAHISSSNSKVTYDYSAKPLSYHFYFSLETGLGSDDYLVINMPLLIHTGTKDGVKFKLISFSNNNEVASGNCQNYGLLNRYYLTSGVSLNSNQWYELQLFPNLDPTTLPFYGTVQLELVSGINSNFILYDSNYALCFLAIESLTPTTGVISMSNLATISDYQRAGAIFSTNIDITPSITLAKGGNFTIKIYNDQTNVNHQASTSGLLDFSFLGICYSVTSPSGPPPPLNFCTISQDFSSISFSISSITAGQTIRIRTEIKNPLYVSKRGLRAHLVEFISGVLIERYQVQVAFTVSQIAINDIGASRLYLFWGISSDTMNSNAELSGLNLGLYKATGSNMGPFNSFNAGFSFSNASPINGRYRVRMFFGATGFLEGSIAHNLPPYAGLKVICNYDTSTKYLICENVGAFVKTGYRYFISGKVFYSSTTVGTSVSGFGDVEILPIIYSTTGSLLSISLYSNLNSGDSIPLKDSQEFIDSSGFHDTNSFKIGMSRVVSMYDDGTLSSTANAMKLLTQGTNNTMGIVPDLGVPQQLLFLMKVNTISSGTGNNFEMRVLYNNKAIGFETEDAASRGLDFVGYDNSQSVWSISKTRCHADGNVVCEKYNTVTPTKNIQVKSNGTNNKDFYGLYKFRCEPTSPVTCLSNDCASACNIFTGKGNSDYGSGVMSMRKVKINSHSSLYADENLMDFIIVFMRGNSVIYSTLINTYTTVGARMQNIKASYVNYFDYSSTSYNKGERIPTMIRIAGGILPKESRNATSAAIFFDDNVDASTFFNSAGTSYDIGCSTGNCQYYPNTGVNLPNNDIWHTMRRVDILNLPSTQNEFNILVPVTPLANRDTFDSSPLPTSLTIAFFYNNHSIGDATGLLKTLSIFRLFGPAVRESITGGIPFVNGLARRSSDNFGSYLSVASPTSYEYPYVLNMAINTSNINANPGDNIFSFGYTGTFTVGTQFGCGITLTSLYYNIFKGSTLSFEKPPLATYPNCTIFSYIYNEKTLGQNNDRNGKEIHTAFCPVDASLTFNSHDANIHFTNPQYPAIITQGFNLSTILTYGVSSPSGQLIHYLHEQTQMPTFVRTCSTSKLHPYNPSNSDGKQRATFTFSIPQIRLSPASKLDGYSKFQIILTLPTSTINTEMLSVCEAITSGLSCTASWTSPTLTIVVSFTGSSTISLTYFEFNLYAITGNSLGTLGNYAVVVNLPQYESTKDMLFGTSFTSFIKLCECTSSFRIGSTTSLKRMSMTLPVLKSTQRSSKSSFYINFASLDLREAFFVDTSSFEFGFGFLTDPAQVDKNTRNNFRCMVYENNTGTLTLSSKFKSLDLSSFSQVKLFSKKTIEDPRLLSFALGCFGSGVPSLSVTSSLSLSWMDGGKTIQSATSLAAASYTSAASVLTASISAKRFNTEGMKAFYSFSITSGQALTENTRFYFNFHFGLNSKLDNQGYIECYIRTVSQTITSFCEITDDRQLKVWNSLITLVSTTIIIDIFNIDVPKSTDTIPNTITIQLDTDSDYTNGVLASQTISDSTPSTLPTNNIVIISTVINTTDIRKVHEIYIKIDTVTNIVTAGLDLYLLFPGVYGEWITRDDVVDECYMEASNNIGTNLLGNCVFISRRVLKMTVSASSSVSVHNIKISNLLTPMRVPVGKENEMRWKIYTTSTSAETVINRYSFTDHSHNVILTVDKNLISLDWYQYSVSPFISPNALVLLPSTFIVYIGYYSNVFELRHALYPSNFLSQINLTLSNLPAVNFVYREEPIVKLGTASTFIRMAGSSSAIPGMYTLLYSKSESFRGKYTEVPPLTLLISNKLCKLLVREVSYSLPRGGTSLPIIISGSGCIPIDSITITATYNNSEVSTLADLSNTKLSSNSEDGQIQIVAQHTLGSLGLGSIVLVSFTITGPNSAYYDTIPSVPITIIDPTLFMTTPGATALSSPVLETNTATFTMQCTSASRIYWGLGIYPSILNSQALDFEARIVSGGMGLMTNFTEPDDYYMRVYGVNPVATSQTISKKLYNLKSNTKYIFKYFCVNQMGIISDGQAKIFTSLNYGAYLMKVNILFYGTITFGQYNDLACSIAQNFYVPYSRVMTEAMSICEGEITPFYESFSERIANEANQNGLYSYNFYILPNYMLPYDRINNQIRAYLSVGSTSTTVISTTSSFIELPKFTQMSAKDIEYYTSPIIKVQSVVASLHEVSIGVAITNMDGFVVIGCMVGIYNSTSMILPTPPDIKRGMMDSNMELLQTKMRFAAANTTITITFKSLNYNQDYTFFYYCTPDDPSMEALSTSVIPLHMKTLDILTVTVDERHYIVWLGVVLMMMLVV